MAENEVLEVISSKRWRKWRGLLLSGADPSTLATHAAAVLGRSIPKALKELTQAINKPLLAMSRQEQGQALTLCPEHKKFGQQMFGVINAAGPNLTLSQVADRLCDSAERRFWECARYKATLSERYQDQAERDRLQSETGTKFQEVRPGLKQAFQDALRGGRIDIPRQPRIPRRSTQTLVRQSVLPSSPNTTYASADPKLL